MTLTPQPLYEKLCDIRIGACSFYELLQCVIIGHLSREPSRECQAVKAEMLAEVRLRI